MYYVATNLRHTDYIKRYSSVLRVHAAAEAAASLEVGRITMQTQVIWHDPDVRHHVKVPIHGLFKPPLVLPDAKSDGAVGRGLISIPSTPDVPETESGLALKQPLPLRL